MIKTIGMTVYCSLCEEKESERKHSPDRHIDNDLLKEWMTHHQMAYCISPSIDQMAFTDIFRKTSGYSPDLPDGLVERYYQHCKEGWE